MHSHFHSANPKRPSWDDSWKWVSTTLIGTSPTYWKIKIFIPMKEGIDQVEPSGASPSSPYTMICQKHKPHNVGSKVMHDWVKWPPNCLVLVPYPSQNWTTSWIPKSVTYYFYSPSCKKSHHLHSHGLMVTLQKDISPLYSTFMVSFFLTFFLSAMFENWGSWPWWKKGRKRNEGKLVYKDFFFLILCFILLFPFHFSFFFLLFSLI